MAAIDVPPGMTGRQASFRQGLPESRPMDGNPTGSLPTGTTLIYDPALCAL